jgi:hypothetical protein
LIANGILFVFRLKRGIAPYDVSVSHVSKYLLRGACLYFFNFITPSLSDAAN